MQLITRDTGEAAHGMVMRSILSWNWRSSFMEKPLDGTNLPSAPGARVIDKPELPAGGIATDQEVYTEVIEGGMHLKVGRYRRFEVYSDEAERIGGTDKHPSPMTYMAMGVGF
jgi:hypothetical protein